MSWTGRVPSIPPDYSLPLIGESSLKRLTRAGTMSRNLSDDDLDNYDHTDDETTSDSDDESTLSDKKRVRWTAEEVSQFDF